MNKEIDFKVPKELKARLSKLSIENNKIVNELAELQKIPQEYIYVPDIETGKMNKVVNEAYIEQQEALERKRDKKEYKKQTKKITDILKEHGIKMMIDGCGCCSSPVVSFEYKGETLINNMGFCRINMFSEDKK